MGLAQAPEAFKPTPESVPPTNPGLRQNLPKGLPVHIHPLNPLAFLLKAAEVYPDHLALAHPDVRHPVFYTYSIWAQRVQNLAYALLQAGIRPGDRVAVLAPNCPLIADAHQGVLAARAVVTPINYRLTPHEVAYILAHSGSSLVLCDYECQALLNDAFAQLDNAHAELVKAGVQGAKDASRSRPRVVVSMDSGRSDDPYEQFLANGRRFSRERGWAGLEMEPNEDAPATLCYTSGTTGRPKGVVSTLRGSYLAAVANVFEAQMTKESKYLWVLPMFHAAGWTFPWANTFATATQVTIRAVNHPVIWKHLRESGITHYCGAPTVQIGIVNDPAARPLTQHVRAIIAGSAPTAHLMGELTKLNIEPVHVYGLTETYGPFTRSYIQPSWLAMSLEQRAKLIARQGHQFATALELRVVKPADESGGSPDEVLIDVPRDGKTVGEIVTRGNITMKEYFRDPAATRKAFRGGYFGSGDLAVMHPDGAVAILDRSKDIIISGGENASSLAIEQELATHPDVLEVAVVARTHPKWGERPMAFVILKPTAADRWKGTHDGFTKSLKEHARKRLPGFACPEWVQVADDLPKTSTGKIQKMALRKLTAKL